MIPDYSTILTQIHQDVIASRPDGKVADYIPGLANISPEKFAIHLHTAEGKDFSVGDSEEKFSIQSITKVLLLAMSVRKLGKKMWERVGVEASGDPFNSLVQLEHEKGIPRNPFINAGALVVCDILMSLYDDPKTDYLNFVRKLSGNPLIDYDESVANSE